ncbi:ATP-binding protein [Sneathiella chinensis]|uniref:histidine kinase n=1 Tax=Sneathiella chinensis TaxID=349750 RepID=A0ABQ5U4D6_9PROT|nr:ATP-binding protein [Sneathiella chinensis]GLQ06952.1 hypothetical protein GCM10007924_21730 [Sneathiella chinensis]
MLSSKKQNFHPAGVRLTGKSIRTALPFVIMTGLVMMQYVLFLLPDWYETGSFILPLSALTVIISLIISGAALSFYRHDGQPLLIVISMMLLGIALTSLLSLLSHILPGILGLALPPSLYRAAATMAGCLFLGLLMGLTILEEYNLLTLPPALRSLPGRLIGLGVVLPVLLVGIFWIIATWLPADIRSQVGQAVHLVALFLLLAALLYLGLRQGASEAGAEFWLIFFLAAHLILTLQTVLTPSLLSDAGLFKVELYRTASLLILMSGLLYRALQVMQKESRLNKSIQEHNKGVELLYTGTLIAANSDNFDNAIRVCLDKMCQIGGWSLGHLYILKEEDRIEHYWASSNAFAYAPFVAAMENTPLEYGVGFAGCIWEDATPNHIDNLSDATGFDNRDEAVKCGLKSVLAVPIQVNGTLLAIMEVYRTRTGLPGELFLGITHAIAEQLSNLYIRETRKRELKRGETLLMELFDSFPGALAIFDRNDRLALFNQAFTNHHRKIINQIHVGTEYGEMITALAYSGNLVEAIGREQEWVEQEMARHTSGFIGVERELSGGRYVRSSEIRMATSGTISLWHDITETKRNEQKLVKAGNILKTSLSGFPGAICVFDETFHLVAANTPFYTLLDISNLKIGEGTSFQDFLTWLRANKGDEKEFRTAVTDLQLLVLRETAPRTMENIQFQKQQLDLHIAPVPGGGFVLSAVDVTKRQRQKTDLAGERDAARELSQAKSDFLAVMSHEIRTPMNGIMTSIDLMQTTGLDEDQSRYTKIIKSSARTLMTLLDDVLDLSRIEARQIDLDPVDFNLKTFLADLNGDWMVQAGAVNLDLDLDIRPGIPELVRADPKRLRQVLDNLISNAVKFTREGTVTIRALPSPSAIPQAGAHAYGKSRVRFEIQDTGPGIGPANRDRLFRKFLKADLSTTRSHGGTGIGLSICKALVNRMGGEIGVDSALGAGATFWVELDLPAGSMDRVVDLKGQTRPLASPGEYRGPPLSILVAEDHTTNQAVIQEVLTKWGHEVRFANNGEEAVIAVANGAFDLVIMDIHMPVMDGYEATREIRALPGSLGKTPIIALTANALAETRGKCIGAGMNNYITKPFEPWELRDTLLSLGGGKTTSLPQTNDRDDRPAQDNPSAKRPDAPRTAPKMAKAPILNQDTINELCEMLGHKVVGQLIDKMQGQFETQRSDILLSLEQQNIRDLSDQVHMLKSNFGQFGLDTAAYLAINTETLLKSGRHEEAMGLVPTLLEKCDEAMDALQNWFARHRVH